MPARNLVLSSDKARARWRDVMDIANGGGDVVVARYGKPTVAIIPYQDYLELVEAIDDLRAARQARAALAEWRQDPTSARSWTDVEAELGADGLVE